MITWSFQKILVIWAHSSYYTQLISQFTFQLISQQRLIVRSISFITLFLVTGNHFIYFSLV